MSITKIRVFIGIVGLITVLMIGCGSSNTNYIVTHTESNSTDDNSTDDNSTKIVSENFTGSAFGLILESLARGMLTEVGGDVMGNFLSLLGWGDSGNSDDTQILNDIDAKITAIGTEITQMENQLTSIMHELKFIDYDIKNTINWPSSAISHINYTSGYMQGLNVNNTAGEGNHTKIKNLAVAILDINDGTGEKVTEIHDAITLGDGDGVGLIQNYILLLLSNMSYNDENLESAYKGLEHFTSILLNNQVTGVNLVIEANKALDDNESAQEYLNCFVNNDSNIPQCNMLYNEIDNLNNPNSFIYNAVSLVLRDAPIYDPFLPPSAEAIFKQAEFYRLMVTGTKNTEFGLRIFHISTADMEKSPDTLYVAKDRISAYSCEASRHTVTGRAYDYWKGNTVKASTNYNVVEYSCDGNIPNGIYQIYASPDLDSKSMGSAAVSQYDTNYDQNSSGSISYGFGLVTHNIPNHFTQSSDKWTIQKPSKDNYNSSTSGSANDWPVKAYASNKKYGYESNAHIELDGHFYYDKDAEKRTMHVSYHAKFYTKAEAPFSNATGGGDAYSYYYVGVYDATNKTYASSDCKNKTYYRLHASSTHKYSSHHDVYNHCSFTAEPGHHYYVYFKMIANECCNPDTIAESELDTVYRVYIMPTY